MKKTFFFYLFLLLASLLLAESIDTVIGDELVSFNVPPDYATLKKYYESVVTMYAEAENKNLELVDHIAKISKATEDVAEATDQVTKDIDKIDDAWVKYQKILNKPYLLYGFGAGYGLVLKEDLLDNIITAMPMIGLNIRRFQFQIGLPIQYMTKEPSLGASLFFSILYHK